MGLAERNGPLGRAVRSGGVVTALFTSETLDRFFASRLIVSRSYPCTSFTLYTAGAAGFGASDGACTQMYSTPHVVYLSTCILYACHDEIENME